MEPKPERPVASPPPSTAQSTPGRRARRRWYSGPLLALKTVWRICVSLRNHRLGIFGPLVILLFIVTVLLLLVATITPLAPFVYSLF